MEFNDAHKEVKEYSSNYFSFGVHRVTIESFGLGTTDDGKEYVEAFFFDPENVDCKDSARLWFTTDKGINNSFNTLRSIFVHNAPEEKKDDARAVMDKVKNTAQMVEILNKTLPGKEMWFTKFFDPERTFTGKDGKVYRSTNKNVYGFRPKEKPDLMPKKDADKDAITAGTVAETFPGAKPDSKGDWF